MEKHVYYEIRHYYTEDDWGLIMHWYDGDEGRDFYDNTNLSEVEEVLKEYQENSTDPEKYVIAKITVEILN